MNKIIGIIFDLDGTLIDSSTHVLASFNYALSPFNITFNYQDIERVRSRTRLDLFQDLDMTDKEQELALTRLDLYRHTHEVNVSLFPGILELLEALKNSQVPLAIWTGRDTPSALEIAESLKIKDYFLTIKGNCGLKKNKPDPEGLIRVAQEIKIQPTELFMIGDHDHDILAGNLSGATSVKVNWANENICSQPPRHQFYTVTELTNFLINYFKGHAFT